VNTSNIVERTIYVDSINQTKIDTSIEFIKGAGLAAIDDILCPINCELNWIYVHIFSVNVFLTKIEKKYNMIQTERYEHYC
jgi:hypothetical protein